LVANELRDSNIKVNAVCPSWISTEMGGRTAPVTPKAAARDIVHFAMLEEGGPTGGFFRFRKPIPW
jgi:NAD(P)-dependent dehydrogenase (short-subunit alcohol dehydrogenase family)